MALSTHDGDLYVTGSLVANAMNLPASAVGDTQVQTAANLSASKLEHQHQPTAVLCDNATSAAAKRVVLHRVYGATATLVKFGVLATVAATGDSTITVALKKNGSAILTASITLDSGTAANALKEPGGYTSTALVTGDVLEAEITAVSAGTGTLPKGVACVAVVREKAQ